MQVTQPQPTLEYAKQVLKEVWGYDSFRGLQENAIESILEGRDSVTILPTGGGKSICFQVPALCKTGMAIVISPLISLMKDQVDSLRANGISAGFINSTQTAEEKREIADLIRSGELRMLYIAPERLLNQRTLDFLKSTEISFVAVDEAHCISNWGHDFRPEYRGLKRLKKIFQGATLHAFTATASEEVRRDIQTQLNLKKPDVWVGSFDRPNLTYRMVRAEKRVDQVIDVVSRHRGEAGVVYCISRKEVEKVATMLRENGISALPYHAGMEDSERQANQEAFIKEDCDVIVATVAFGMGIDKSNVRFVVHAGMPKSLEHYQQESGRAGRDGLPSECVLIHSASDLMTWKRIMSNESGAALENSIRSLDAMYELCCDVRCRHRSIVEYFGEEYGHENCEACDVCLNELDLVEDPITLSQKILSCILRLEQRFGPSYTAKVLCGAKDDRIEQFGHNRLSTFGLLSADKPTAVRTWIDQLTSQGFLLKEGEYQTLSLTDSGRKLLRREGEPRLTVATKTVRNRRSKSSAEATSWEGVDRDLFEALKQLRTKLAKEKAVPAYVIFNDGVLRDLAKAKPTALPALAAIKGIGAKKQQEFGQLFIDEIQSHGGT